MKKNGFTLIELMLVVAIIALLAAIALPQFANLIEKSREASNRGNMGTVRSALEIYYVDNDGIYPRYAMGPTCWGNGTLELQGKYVDLDKIHFRSPGYIHSPSLTLPGTAIIGFGNFGPTPVLDPITPDLWLPQYDYYATGPIGCGPVPLARVGFYCTHTDLSGRTWSTW
ncbi:MAG: type II secretion system protein [Elusimicrobia bacterium]|nr:type II secretion system protein [Elusimicrobiota bacterium]